MSDIERLNKLLEEVTSTSSWEKQQEVIELERKIEFYYEKGNEII